MLDKNRNYYCRFNKILDRSFVINVHTYLSEIEMHCKANCYVIENVPTSPSILIQTVVRSDFENWNTKLIIEELYK